MYKELNEHPYINSTFQFLGAHLSGRSEDWISVRKHFDMTEFLELRKLETEAKEQMAN